MDNGQVSGFVKRYRICEAWMENLSGFLIAKKPREICCWAECDVGFGLYVADK